MPVRKEVEQIHDEHIECRTLQHAWRYTEVERKDRRTLEQWMLCPRCSTRKVQEIDSRTGEIRATRYHYPEGYVIDGLGFMSKAERGSLRLRAISRKTRR